MTISRQAIGSRSRASGAAFEKLIEVSCEVYKNKELAYIEKTPEPMRPISRADRCGRFMAVYTATAQPDYKGTLSGGRAVVFEAKHTDSDTMKQERVTPAQAEALSMHYNLGALCFVLISIKDRYFAIPLELWDDMKQIYGRKHITTSDVKEYEAKIIANKGSVYLDFLSAALISLRKAKCRRILTALKTETTTSEWPRYTVLREGLLRRSHRNQVLLPTAPSLKQLTPAVISRTTICRLTSLAICGSVQLNILINRRKTNGNLNSVLNQTHS